jgi:hypothetical protein
MEPQTQTVFDAAQALPEAERALLVERLLETLPPERPNYPRKNCGRNWIDAQQISSPGQQPRSLGRSWSRKTEARPGATASGIMLETHSALSNK